MPPLLPRSDWANDFGVPWWKDVKYEVGILSAKTRLVRVINTLTSQEHMLEVSWEGPVWPKGRGGRASVDHWGP